MNFNYKEHRLLNEFITSTRISEFLVEEMLKELNIVTFFTERGQTINKGDYERLINSDNFKMYYKDTLKFGIDRYQKDQKTETKIYFEKRIQSEIASIKKHVGELE